MSAWDYSPEPENDVEPLINRIKCDCGSKNGPWHHHETNCPLFIAHKASEANPAPKATDFLKAAAKHMEDRASTYDKPEGERSMAQTVAIFNLFHGTNLTEAQGWHFMETVKNVRFFTKQGFHRDSGEDGIAYAALKTEAKQREA